MTSRVLLLENISPVAVELLSEAGFEVEALPRALGEADLIAALDGVEVLGLRSKTQVCAAVLDRHPQLKVLGAFCIGTNQIDLQAAAEAGAVVFHAPYSNTRSVVELAIAEIVCLARRLLDRDRALQAGFWDKSATGSHEVRGRTLGIVGYGNIGSQLSVVAETLGMRVLFYDLQDKLALGTARRCDSLEELLERSETVSLHVDGRPANVGLIGDAQLRRMPRRSLLLNLSRGFVVDHDALAEHLASGHLAGAAIDVYPQEPHANGEPFDSPLRGLPNVILTPHVGGSTQEAQHDIGRFVAGKIIDHVQGGSTATSVNLPSVALPDPIWPRLGHLHRNVPGVLARSNEVLARHGVNVAAQVLGTRGEFGYSLTATGGSVPASALAELRALPETVRLLEHRGPDHRGTDHRGTGNALRHPAVSER